MESKLIMGGSDDRIWFKEKHTGQWTGDHDENKQVQWPNQRGRRCCKKIWRLVCSEC